MLYLVFLDVLRTRVDRRVCAEASDRTPEAIAAAGASAFRGRCLLEFLHFEHCPSPKEGHANSPASLRGRSKRSSVSPFWRADAVRITRLESRLRRLAAVVVARKNAAIAACPEGKGTCGDSRIKAG
jgi:hypothetical protein